MKTEAGLSMKLSALPFGLLALFNLAIGVFHTVLFTFQGSQSLFVTAYDIPVTALEMRDPARLLGSDAIEMYSILLGGYGMLSIWATIESLRGHRYGFWLNTVMGGMAQIATLYALIIPGRLSGPNAYASLVLYTVGVLLGGLSLVRRQRSLEPSAIPTPSGVG